MILSYYSITMPMFSRGQFQIGWNEIENNSKSSEKTKKEDDIH